MASRILCRVRRLPPGDGGGGRGDRGRLRHAGSVAAGARSIVTDNYNFPRISELRPTGRFSYR